MRGVCDCGQGLWFHVLDPEQQQDEDHRGKQEPEETQDIEAQEEAAKVRVEKRVVSGTLHIPLSHTLGLQEVDKFRDGGCGGF